MVPASCFLLKSFASKKLHQKGIFSGIRPRYFATDGSSETHAGCEE